jgi:membrane associated rhomboid family serine protease
MEVQRLPYVTIGIVAVCIFVHMITHFAAGPDQKRLIAAERELVEYYLNNPNLELSEEVRKKLSPEARQTIAQIDKFNEIMLTTVTEVDDELQEELNGRSRDFEEALSSDYFRKYGYIPAEGGIVKIFTSMFIHGGILHLLGNLLFLWLAV